MMDTTIDQSAASGLSFTALCSVLKAVEATNQNDMKLNLIFSANLRAQVGESDLYPLIRLLLPQLDRERTYMLKEKKIAKIYIDVLGLAPISKDAQKLEHFNDPKIVDSKSVGDFAAVLFDVVLYQGAGAKSKKPHTLGDVNDLLDQLVRADTIAARKKMFMKIATEYAADEQKWLIRVVLKDLKIGLRHERVLSFIHPDALEMYNHTNDLHKICRELRNSAVRYVPQLEPFQVFTPMLAKRVDFGECITAINADAFVMEPKLDGERITCHVREKEVQFISRNGVNYTEDYAPSIKPHVLSQLEPGIDCILDGEMMVWDNTEYRLREFGLLKNTAIAVRKGEATNRWLCYIVWDVVYLGGGPKAEALIREVFRGPGEIAAVMGLPLHARRKLLLRILKPLDNRIIIIEQKLVNEMSAKERHDRVMAEVDAQIANGGEGVIIKDLKAHYMCGESSRKAKKWLKLKPDYAGMTTDLDTIIVGGFYGTGRRRSGNVSVFLLGVLARSLDEKGAAEVMKSGAVCPGVYTFAKVGTGYNLEELEQMRQELAPYWQPWDDNNIPQHLNGWKPQKSDLRPDVWIDPRRSKILEVYGFELSFTTLYQTGLTIRFPRCKAIRNDKEWYQCIDLQDLNAARGSLSTKRASEVALGEKSLPKRIKKRETISKWRPSGVLEDYSRAELEGIELERNVFEGMQFCVVPGKYQVPPLELKLSLPAIIKEKNDLHITKQGVEKLLHLFGGIVVQNPIVGSTHFVVASGDAGLKVANLRKQGLFNIVHIRWVFQCVSASHLVPIKATDYIFTTNIQRELLAKEYDRYGDHFTEHLSPGNLRQILRELSMSTEDDVLNVPWQLKLKYLAIEEAEAMDSAFTFLSHCVVYFQSSAPSCLNENEDSDFLLVGQMKLFEQQLRLYGGIISGTIDSSVTHVVVADPAQVKQVAPLIRNLRHQGLPVPPVVSREWVKNCVEQKCQLPVNDFVMHL
ncbi:atp-dependent dna ligase iv [Plasmopara halstedii]|uniref:DNA ligase n=1 Tax=Plasmopara halstedii TaxID=4781 RepID=A0A0P1AQN8_PLAHL|nr:atp-dependent dna ligase iv [Plasmopara halstedii]CEG43549.1 atp-dependent dna ligase iv [Plasmopara halstedii]|eukprot:XP_024579918.1 atp-dependent dna ligase iv [Plasmopara halstedii]